MCHSSVMLPIVACVQPLRASVHEAPLHALCSLAQPEKKAHRALHQSLGRATRFIDRPAHTARSHAHSDASEKPPCPQPSVVAHSPLASCAQRRTPIAAHQATRAPRRCMQPVQWLSRHIQLISLRNICEIASCEFMVRNGIRGSLRIPSIRGRCKVEM